MHSHSSLVSDRRVIFNDSAVTPSHRCHLILFNNPLEHELMISRLAFLRSTLSSFAASPDTFAPVFSKPTPVAPAKTLFVLDSSFNPPTKAHLNIALSSFCDASTGPPQEKRLLLLLATQNADKGSQPFPSPQEWAGLTPSKPPSQPHSRKDLE